MALTKAQKKTQVEMLTQKMSDARSMVFANYIGLSVADISELRNKLREENAEMKVAKKTLMKIASKEAGLPDIDNTELDGPVSIIFSYNDAISGAQIAFKFAKTHKQVELIGGIFDGKILTKEQAVELAKMPSRIELLATFVGMLKSPTTKFATLCGSPLSGFARALSQMAEKGGFSDEAPSAPVVEEKAEAPVVEPTEEKAEETTDNASESTDTEAPADSTEDTSDNPPAEEAKADDAEDKQDA